MCRRIYGLTQESTRNQLKDDCGGKVSTSLSLVLSAQGIWNLSLSPNTDEVDFEVIRLAVIDNGVFENLLSLRVCRN